MLRCIQPSRYLWSCYSAVVLPSRGKTIQVSLIVALLYVCVNVLLFRPRSSQQRQFGLSTTNTTLYHPIAHPKTGPEESWCQHYSNESQSVLPAQVLSQELIVRRVFFDRRRRNGFPNSTVFLVEAKGKKIGGKNFVGCRVGPYVSNEFYFRPAVSYKVVQRTRNAQSTLALIDCYNIHAVGNGDTASVFYKGPNGLKVEVQSLKSLSVPEPKAALNSTASAVVCVGVIRSGKHSPSDYGMLYHWLHYQKVIGVDHVHMAAENSFVRDGGLHHDVIQRAVKEGYLSIDFWPFWLNPTKVVDSQKIVYQDCVYRFQGIYDYIIYADSDDFFVPVGKSKSIKHYLQRWCSGETATCQFKWIQYFPECGWDPKSVGADGNFTESMTYKKTRERPATKSGHQLKALVDAGTHRANTLLDGYKQTRVSVKEAYFAHVRFGKLPTGGC